MEMLNILFLAANWRVSLLKAFQDAKANSNTPVQLIAVDSEKTLIDVEMENSTSFILYMIYRDYSEPEIETNQSQGESNDTSDEEQDNEQKKGTDSEDIEWLKLGRNVVFIFMALLIISEILVMIGIPFRATIRVMMWILLVLDLLIMKKSKIRFVGDYQKWDIAHQVNLFMNFYH